MNLYELSRNNLKTINVHLKEVGGYNYHKIQTPFGLAQAKNLPQGLDIVWPEMKLRCHLGFNHLKFTDMNNTMEKMGQILLAFGNSDIYLDEITYIIDKEEFKMQEDDLHLKHITTYLWEKYGIDIEGIADSNQPFSEYSTNDFLVSIYRDNITIMVEVCRYLRKLS